MSARMSEEQYAEFEKRRSRGRPRKVERVARVKEKLISVLTRHDYKADLVEQLRFRGVPVTPEFKIFESRRFKADWRVTDTRILIEFEGGLFASGKQGHSSVTGILRDMEKYNLCALGGWIVIRVCPKHVASGEALRWIEIAVESENARNAKPITQ